MCSVDNGLVLGRRTVVVLHPKCEALRGDGLHCQNPARFMLAGKRVCQLRTHRSQFGNPELAVHIRDLANRIVDVKHISQIINTMSKKDMTPQVKVSTSYSEQVEIFELIKTALTQPSWLLKIHYRREYERQDPLAGSLLQVSEKEHLIVPFYLHKNPQSQGIVLNAWDTYAWVIATRTRGAVRNFRVDRMKSCTAIDAGRNLLDPGTGMVRLYPAVYDLLFATGLQNARFAPAPKRIAAVDTAAIAEYQAKGYSLSRPTFVVDEGQRLPEDNPNRKTIFVAVS